MGRLTESSELNALNFEYAVLLSSPLVAIFRSTYDEWEFVCTAKRWNAINICQLEQSLEVAELFIFPLGLRPNQVWSLLQKLEYRK